MEHRRGKYWSSDPKRIDRAVAKRERRKLRNIKTSWALVQARL